MPSAPAVALALSWPPRLRAGSEVLVAPRFGGSAVTGKTHQDKTEGQGRKDDSGGLGVLLGSSPKQTSSRQG